MTREDDFSLFFNTNNNFKCDSPEQLNMFIGGSNGYIVDVRDISVIKGLTLKLINDYSHDTVPVSCEVFLYDGIYKRMVGKTVSNYKGEYIFKNLKSDYSYYITSVMDGESTIQFYITS